VKGFEQWHHEYLNDCLRESFEAMGDMVTFNKSMLSADVLKKLLAGRCSVVTVDSEYIPSMEKYNEYLGRSSYHSGTAGSEGN
jgi:hypothetical protein